MSNTGLNNGMHGEIKLRGKVGKKEGRFHKYSKTIFTDTDGINYFRVRSEKFHGWKPIKDVIENQKK